MIANPLFNSSASEPKGVNLLVSDTGIHSSKKQGHAAFAMKIKVQAEGKMAKMAETVENPSLMAAEKKWL